MTSGNLGRASECVSERGSELCDPAEHHVVAVGYHRWCRLCFLQAGSASVRKG